MARSDNQDNHQDRPKALTQFENHKKALWDDERDLYLYSGRIQLSGARDVAQTIFSMPDRSKKASLILSTYGGDLDSAFRLIRAFTLRYDAFRVCVVGPCKSAGTLVTLGAHEVAVGPFGELGPLDVQLSQEDELYGLRSGLDTLDSLDVLQKSAFDAFQQYMLDIIERSDGVVSTKTACDIATEMVTGLFRPIAEQIDPTKIAFVERNMRVAQYYGDRVKTNNVRTGAIRYLAREYPSHGFIIDWKEALDIFHEVDRLSDIELFVGNLYGELVHQPSYTASRVVNVIKELDRRIQNAKKEDEQRETQDVASGGHTTKATP